MVSKVERFWISFILRFAFGFFFLIAALNIFNYGPVEFAEMQAKPMLATWIGNIQGADLFVKYWLISMPYAMAALSVPILTGIFLKPALRLSALMLVCFGLGKYIQLDIATTAADFTFALIICLGLYVLNQEPADEAPVASAEPRM